MQTNCNKLLIIKINMLEWEIEYSLFQTINNKTHLISYNNQKVSFVEINYLIHKKKLIVIKSIMYK